MKAALWYGRHDIRLEDVPEPRPGPEDVVIRIDWCGICGTDLGEYQHGPLFIPVHEPHPLTGIKAPIILGHEFAGEIVEIGRNVRERKIGEEVGCDTILFCGHCFWCTRHQYPLCSSLGALGLHGHGGLAEYCVAPAYMCLRLTGQLTPEIAPLAETLSVVVRALRRGRMQIGETVVIIGAGAVGLLAVQLARTTGARAVYVVEPSQHRRQIAAQLGADVVLDPATMNVFEAITELTGGIGADLALECAGHHTTIAMAIDLVRRGGRAVLVGIPHQETHYNFAKLVMAEKELIGSLSHVYDEDYSTAIRLLGDGRVQADSIISHRIALTDIITDGFERLGGGHEDVIKIIVSPFGEQRTKNREQRSKN